MRRRNKENPQASQFKTSHIFEGLDPDLESWKHCEQPCLAVKADGFARTGWLSLGSGELKHPLLACWEIVLPFSSAGPEGRSLLAHPWLGPARVLLEDSAQDVTETDLEGAEFISYVETSDPAM